MKDVFEDIIRNRKWAKHICGAGSTLSYTQNLRQELKSILRNLRVQSMLDAPCGDYSWMSTIKFGKKFSYIGADIVSFMIENNIKQYPGTKFLVMDITKDQLPEVDLLFCRDCLLHLPFSSIQKVFTNFKNSNIKYLATSNWFEQYDNYKDINAGESRYLNFLEEPFNFPKPITAITDYVKGFPKREMLFWSKESLLNKI